MESGLEVRQLDMGCGIPKQEFNPVTTTSHLCIQSILIEGHGVRHGDLHCAGEALYGCRQQHGATQAVGNPGG